MIIRKNVLLSNCTGSFLLFPGQHIAVNRYNSVCQFHHFIHFVQYIKEMPIRVFKTKIIYMNKHREAKQNGIHVYCIYFTCVKMANYSTAEKRCLNRMGKYVIILSQVKELHSVYFLSLISLIYHELVCTGSLWFIVLSLTIVHCKLKYK